MSSGVRFGRVLLLTRGAEGVSRAIEFYEKGLGINLLRATDDWAELACDGSHDKAGGSFRLTIKSVENEAQLSKGYSPVLSFDVDDMDSVITRCVQMGAFLDGPIQYPAHGKVAVLRSPDGHMIGLYEPLLNK
jgi:predicted enzyme related to lactoylglutathione lyase